MLWYNNELVAMAKEIGYRLLPAFNTSTGIPYPRVSPVSYHVLGEVCVCGGGGWGGGGRCPGYLSQKVKQS